LVAGAAGVGAVAAGDPDLAGIWEEGREPTCAGEGTVAEKRMADRASQSFMEE
jgi:hypothetical protein